MIQVAIPGEAWAIDALAAGLDLAPFWQWLTDSPSLKVLHAPRQDFEIVYHQTDRLPTPVFDTQTAAMVLGYGDSPGFDSLARDILGHGLDKAQQYTDWARRPLTDRQLEYAYADVIYLCEIYEKLSSRLKQEGRESWIADEMAVLNDPATYRVEPTEAWRRLKFKVRKPRYLAILREIAAWREETAISRDVPRGRILKDDSILDLAGSRPRTLPQLEQCRGFNNGLSRTDKEAILAAIAHASALPEADCPQLPSRQQPAAQLSAAAIDLLKVLLKSRCETLGLVPRLVISNHDLEALATGAPLAEKLKGWRYDIFGKDAAQLLSGALSLSIGGDGTLRVSV